MSAYQSISLSLYQEIDLSICLSIYLKWFILPLESCGVAIKQCATATASQGILSNERLASFSFKVTIPHV